MPRRRSSRRSCPRARRRPRSGPSRRCRTSPRASGRPARLRIPSDSPVSSDSSTVSPRVSTTGPSATNWSPGSTRRRRRGRPRWRVSSTSAPVADHLRPRGDQQREVVEGLLRLQLLADADVGVDDRDQPEERVGEQAQGDHQDEEGADDRVEQRQDVRPDDARDRAAVRRLWLAEASEPALGFGAGKSHALVSHRLPSRSFIEDVRPAELGSLSGLNEIAVLVVDELDSGG